jgi:hypothetical protein
MEEGDEPAGDDDEDASDRDYEERRDRDDRGDDTEETSDEVAAPTADLLSAGSHFLAALMLW